jgi:hypothetical protein
MEAKKVPVSIASVPLAHDHGPLIGAKLGTMRDKGVQRLHPPSSIAPNPQFTPVLRVLSAHRGRVCVTIQICHLTKGHVPTDLARAILSD